MKVSEMVDLRKLRFAEKPVPTPEDGEALVKVEYVGVCGSDLHFFEFGCIGDIKVEYPFVLGHEAAGTVVSVGKDVTGLKVGDRVALEPGITCGKCEFCKTGRYNLCPDVRFFATPPIGGVFQEYVAHPADLCFKLPDNVDCLEGAMVEPLSVGFHAVDRSEGRLGDSAVVFGSGCIGLCTVLALQANGITDITVVDILDCRLEMAKKLGAKTVNGAKEDTLLRCAEITGGKGFDLAFETAGTAITTNNAMRAVKKGATVTLIGYSKKGSMELPTSLMIDKELNIKTIFRYRHSYPKIIAAIAAGRIDVKQIVTDIFDFDDIQKGLDASIDCKDTIVKAAIKI